MATASISALNNRVGLRPGNCILPPVHGPFPGGGSGRAEIPEVLAGYIVSYVFPVRIIRDAGEVLP